MRSSLAASSLRPEGENEATAGAAGRRVGRLRWWKEVSFIVAFYLVYSWIRNQFGSESVGPGVAFAHAKEIIALEKAIGSYHEEAIQQAFLGFDWFIKSVNVFYGTLHFAATGGMLLLIYLRHRSDYPRWRTTLAWTTGLALIGFATYPLLPPRLLPAHYGFVDTLEVYGGPWSFDHGVFKEVSNQFAAMPSLHFGWALWCGLAARATMRRRWARYFAVLYPAFTLLAVVITANHYWIDAVGGALCVAVGWAVAVWWYERRDRAEAAEAPG